MASLSQAKPGDLVTFGIPADHIGIYIGGNKMIVAPHTGDVVKVQTVYEKPSHIRRVLSANLERDLAGEVTGVRGDVAEPGLVDRRLGCVLTRDGRCAGRLSGAVHAGRQEVRRVP